MIDILYLHEWDGIDAARGDLLGARHPRRAGQGPLRGGFELFRLAPDEGAGGRRRARISAAGHPADPLYARGAGGRVRAGADRPVAEGVGILVWSPLAGGLLSGKYGPEAPSARQLGGRHEPPIRDVERLWRIVAALKEVGAAHGVSAAQVALAWLLGRPGVASLVIGGRDAGAVPRQPGGGGARARARGAGAARRGERPAGALPLLAPEPDRIERFGPADSAASRPTARPRSGTAGADGVRGKPLKRLACANRLKWLNRSLGKPGAGPSPYRLGDARCQEESPECRPATRSSTTSPS